MKIDKKYAGVLAAIIMSVLMATLMSFALTLINVGFNDALLRAFIKTWGMALCVAVPMGMLLMPLVKRIVCKITE